MGKLSLATRLADEIGVTVERASRFIDDVGPDEASRFLDEAAQGSDTRKLPSGWWKPTLAVGGTGAALGGGALLWRQQDVERARAIAEQGKNYQDTLEMVVKSDLPPDLKRKLARGAASAAPGGGGGGRGGGDGGVIPDDPATLIVLVIVMAIVLKFALDGGDD